MRTACGDSAGATVKMASVGVRGGKCVPVARGQAKSNLDRDEVIHDSLTSREDWRGCLVKYGKETYDQRVDEGEYDYRGRGP